MRNFNKDHQVFMVQQKVSNYYRTSIHYFQSEQIYSSINECMVINEFYCCSLGVASNISFGSNCPNVSKFKSYQDQNNFYNYTNSDLLDLECCDSKFRLVYERRGFAMWELLNWSNLNCENCVSDVGCEGC